MSLVQRREGIEVALYPFYTREKEKMMVTFKSDVSKRKRLFTPASFAHPAKMHLGMLLWIIGKYTKPGETVLDPMAGAGSTMLATRYGRNVVLVELEQKFVDMMAGYDCGGKIIGYKEVEHEEIKAGWVIDVEDGYWYSEPFATKEEAEKFIKDGAIKSVLTAWKGTEQVEISHQEYVPEWIDKIPQTKCGKTEQHEPHRVPGNWERIKTLPKTKYGLGDCQIFQGDARQLTSILCNVPQCDVACFSPPYAGSVIAADGKFYTKRAIDTGRNPEGAHVKGASEEITNPDNITNLPYGQIDKIISSPPYEEAMGEKHHSPRADKLAEEKSNPVTYTDKVDAVISSPPYEGSVSDNKESPLAGGDEAKYGRWAKGTAKKISYTQDGQPCKEVDSIITSPPYEGALTSSSQHGNTGIAADNPKLADTGRYKAENNDNIGNLKNDSYLSAMLQVYAQCYEVLKPGGLMILVTKDFIRNKQRVFLSIDTIKLCEQVGFVLEDWHERKLTQQSFWRIIYYQKHPEVEKLLTEDILVFKKEEGEGKVDTIISSPPYASEQTDNRKVLNKTILDHKGMGQGYREGYNEDNIARLPYGSIDAVITSPPFAGNTGGLNSARNFKYGDDPVGKRMMGGIKGGTGENPDNIDRLPYGQIDAIITSPPYAETATGSPEMTEGDKQHRIAIGRNPDSPGSGYPRAYSANPSNIGNLPYGGSK